MPQKDKSGQPQAPEPRSKAALAPFVTDSTGDPTPPLGNPGNPLQVGGRMSMSLTRAEVTITDDAVSHVVAFFGPELFETFGLPPVLDSPAVTALATASVKAQGGTR